MIVCGQGGQEGMKKGRSVRDGRKLGFEGHSVW